MKNNIFSSYTNTVREIFSETDKIIADYIIDDNIESVWDSHDNWDGGIDFYHIIIRIPVKAFKQLENKSLLVDYEKTLQDCYNAAIRGENSSIQLNSVVFQPTSEDVYTIGDNTDYSMWTNGYFRLFISHLTDDKMAATNLKICIKPYGVDCFVAHEDIRISREWQTEIENALFTMDALCAIVTPKFCNSDWCDQEVGIALGQRKAVLPISKDKMPYGFFGKYQALKSIGKNANEIARCIWLTITENTKTKQIYFDKFLSLIINSTTTDEALERLKILKECPNTNKNVVIALRERYQETSVMKEKEVIDNMNQFFEQYGVESIKVSAPTPVLDNNDLPF